MFFVCSNGASECISLLWVEMNCVICPMITLNYEWFGPDVATNKIVREHNTMWIQFVRHRNICKKMWHNLWFYVVLLFSLAYSSMAWIAYYELPGLKWSFAKWSFMLESLFPFLDLTYSYWNQFLFARWFCYQTIQENVGIVNIGKKMNMVVFINPEENVYHCVARDLP